MSRKSTLAIVFVLFALFTGILIINKPQSALAQEALKTVTLEGTIVDSEGDPLTNGNVMFFSTIELFLDGQRVGGYEMQTGGRYHIEGLKKGLYQMIVTAADADVRKRDRVKRYLGLLIKPGKALQLNVKLSKGQGVEQVGEDAVEYPNVIIVSEMLAKMQKEIDALKQENEELKKQVAALKK